MDKKFSIDLYQRNLTIFVDLYHSPRVKLRRE